MKEVLLNKVVGKIGGAVGKFREKTRWASSHKKKGSSKQASVGNGVTGFTAKRNDPEFLVGMSARNLNKMFLESIYLPGPIGKRVCLGFLHWARFNKES